MDIEAHPDLIYGEEFCFPATATYYPTLHAPTGMNAPAEFYERPTVPGFNNQGLHYAGHQAEGTSCMYYVVPDYGIAHTPSGPHPLYPFAHPPHGPHHSRPCAMSSGPLSGGQELSAETVEHTYYQQFYTSHYAVLPSVTPPINAQPLAHTSGLFLPHGLNQTVADSSESGVAWSSSLQSASVSSMKFQNRTSTMLPEGHLHGTAPRKRQLADRSRLPDKVLRARQASRQSRHLAVPSVQTSLQSNLSYNNHVSNVGSDFYKMSAEKSYPCSKTSSHANRRSTFQNQQNISKPKKPLGLMPSEFLVKCYTSRLDIGNEKGEIILRTDQYNRDDFKVVYPNAKFFVIKSFDEADVHKSIKYGVWSTSSAGNKKLDSAFREAQVIAASDSTSCPVFLFFSINRSFCFCGVAEMVGPVDWQKDMDFWCTDKWIGSFPVKWHIIKDVYNSTLRGILLQNNGDMPVTSSRDTQEIHYTPGTTMLKIFKYAKTDKCLLDEFMMHEEKEAKSSQRRRLKLRQAAPQFMPASVHAHQTYSTLMPKSPQLMPASMHAHQHHTYSTMLPKSPQFMPASVHAHQTYETLLLPPRSDSLVTNRITRETNDLTGKLRGLNLDRRQLSWRKFGNLASIGSTANTQSYGIQGRENSVKATTYQQAYQPLTWNVKPASDGEQQCWKKVEIAPTEDPRPEAATTSLSSKALEEYPNEGENALVHSASEVPEMISEEQKITGRPRRSLATNPQSSQGCSKPRAISVAIGSVLVPIVMSS